MPKKTLTTVLLVALLILLTTKTQKTWPQNNVYPLASGIFIMSPSNTTYNSEPIVLNTSVTAAVGTNIHVSMTYSLDGTKNKTLATKTHIRDNSFLKQILASTNLSNLADGPHKITIYAKYAINNQIIGNENSTVHFSVNSNSKQILEFSTQNILILTILATTVILIYKKHPSISFSG